MSTASLKIFFLKNLFYSIYLPIYLSIYLSIYFEKQCLKKRNNKNYLSKISLKQFSILIYKYPEI